MSPRTSLVFALALAVSAALSGCDSSASTSSSGGTTTATPDTRTFGVAWNASATYGTFTDARDGRTYRTVALGSQTWMAQNLAFRRATGSADSIGTCYYKSGDSCAKYGALYTWDEAMAGESSSHGIPSGVQGVCPSGWHLPSDTEWVALKTSLGLGDKTGAALKSTAGWNDGGAGTDSIGFRGLPGGYLYSGSAYSGNGRTGCWWTSTALSGMYSHHISLEADSDEMFASNTFMGNSVSVRCVKN